MEKTDNDPKADDADDLKKCQHIARGSLKACKKRQRKKETDKD